MNDETVSVEKNVTLAAKEIIKLERKHYYGEDNAGGRLRKIREIIDNGYKNLEET
jgi:RAB protein geranylgeranyltransferase component A